MDKISNDLTFISTAPFVPRKMSIVNILSIDNPVFRGYVFYGSVLVLKMLVMSILTGRLRSKFKAFANPEDSALANVIPKINEEVEIVRRAHRNDLENVPIFFIAAFGYLLANPTEGTAILLFRFFTIARFIHTIGYVIIAKQPIRGLGWLTGFLITGYMAVTTVLNFY